MMNRFIRVLSAAVLATAVMSCSKVPEDDAFSVTLSADKTTVDAGNDPVTFKVIYGKEDVTKGASIKMNDAVFEGNVFVPAEAGTYKFTASYKDKTSNEVVVTVNSAAMNVTPETVSFDFDGKAVDGGVVAVVKADWTASVTEGAKWIAISADKGADGDSFTVSVSVNSGKERSGAITVTSVSGTDTKTITVKQAALTVTKDPNAVEFTNGYSEYFGEGQFFLSLFTMKINEDGYPLENGVYTTLVLKSNEPPTDNRENIVHPAIASGIYTVSDSGELYAIVPGKTEEEGGYDPSGLVKVIDVENFGFEILAVKKGRLLLDRQGDGKFAISFEFQLSDGSTFKGYHNGTLGLINRTVSTSLIEDVKMEPLTNGNMKSRSQGQTRYYEIELTSADIKMEEGTGTGDRVKIELFAPKESESSVIPAGTYRIDDSCAAGTIYRGTSTNGTLFGSWYRRIENGKIDKNKQGPLHSGMLTVTHDNGVCTIHIDALDDIGNKISGSFEGSVELR